MSEPFAALSLANTSGEPHSLAKKKFAARKKSKKTPSGKLTLMRQNSGRSRQDVRDAHEPLTCRGVIREPQPRGATGADEQRGAVEEFEPQRLHTLQQRHDRVSCV